MNDFETERIFFDKFTTSSGAPGPLSSRPIARRHHRPTATRERRLCQQPRVRSDRAAAVPRSSPTPTAANTGTSSRKASGPPTTRTCTVDVQPDPERYLIQDWIISFPDGTRRLCQGQHRRPELELARVPRSRPGVGAHALSAPVEDRDDGAERHQQRPQVRARRRRSTRPGSRSCRRISAPGSMPSSASARR